MPSDLRIHYNLETFASQKEARFFDDSLSEFLTQYGFHRWASGMDLETGIRDIAYDGSSQDVGPGRPTTAS